MLFNGKECCNYMKEKWPVFKKKWKELWKKFFYSCYVPSFFCYLIIELCSRKSVINLGLFFLTEPLVFFYNVLIIAATASVCLLFRRRLFVLSVVLLLWLAIGVTDMVMLSFRTTPFTAVDLALITDALKIANRYFSWVGVVLIVVGVAAALLLCVYVFRKAKKEEGSLEYGVRIPFCGLLLLLCCVLTNFGMAVGLLDRNFGNLAQAFHENGLPYCFMNSVINTGVKRPDNYSVEAIGNLLEVFAKEEGRELVTEFPKPTDLLQETPSPKPMQTPVPTGMTAGPEGTGFPEMSPSLGAVMPEPTIAEADGSLTEMPGLPETGGTAESVEDAEQKEDSGMMEDGRVYPNIIFLQLESFFDVNYIENFSCTENPIPFFTYLKENYSSGFLEVPSIGAGTANTEFECITGMNLDFFGPGEYPYKTILKEQTCESMAYILKGLGYSASAMHNNDGTFYGRNRVFSNLGFDRYVSVEYMENAPVNELNWARDRVLVEQIRKVLSGTKERDYIYAISVQGHGAYPKEPLLAQTQMDVQLPEELSEYYYQYLYYVHQLKEMDSFLEELILNLSACQEEVVLVLYGDHLPSLGLSDELLQNENAFQTEYVIWTNFEFTAEDKDIQAYQLSARVLETLGIEAGIMPQYHTYRYDEEDYLENMQLLMYDMLYGEQEVYGGENPYEPTELYMGIDEIRIREVYQKESLLTEDGPLLYVVGQNFTEWSKIVINDKAVETFFLTDGLLAARTLPKSKDGIYYITVRQQGNNGIMLSETEAAEYRVEN